MPDNEWPELEDAKRKREAERERKLREIQKEPEKTARWHVTSKLIRSGENRLSLYWETAHGAFYYRGWFIVELQLDEKYSPVGFKVECKEPGFFLSSKPTIEDLKDILLQAFELGPVSDLHRKSRAGVPFEELAA